MQVHDIPCEQAKVGVAVTGVRCGARGDAREPGGGALNTALSGQEISMPGTGKAPSRPGILLDRDGTIIVDHGYVGSVDRVEFIDGAPEAIAGFNRAGIPVAVVTNQSGVARGLYGLDDVARVHRHIADRLAECGAHIDLFVYCPYHPDGVVEAFARTSDDRKPWTGHGQGGGRGARPRPDRVLGRRRQA